MKLNLLSNAARLETPFIYITIGENTFGVYDDSKSESSKYPNYMKSITINKVNGAVNTYTIAMEYGIAPGNDPNLLEKAFSSVSKTRAIKISYGDYSAPSYIFKEESAIITDIQSTFDISNSKIHYTLTCTSQSLLASVGNYIFEKKFAKPSDIIKEILYNTKYGLLDIFTGMRDKEKVLINNLIASDDKQVTIEAKSNISALDYLNYLVSCMSNIANTSNTIINNSNYVLNIVDDISGDFGGTYFKVSRIDTSISINTSSDIYEIDIGTISKDIITNFSINDNQTYSLLYNYSNNVDQTDYIYRIDNDGNIISEYSPNISSSSTLYKTTESDKSWWTQVTQYPINATITLKGLLRPAILMSYVKLNVYFYGRKHISSGIYVITKQTDTINNSGYRTELSLLRIRGDESYDN